MADIGEYDVELSHCIWKDCKGELVELEAYSSVNWITIVYRCTHCGREFTVKIET
ncbi:MAG: hypothetical protein JWQ98_3240 [Chlorobi bacterium]|nr:hypothetical protein [Chlorobiota bacterium]